MAKVSWFDLKAGLLHVSNDQGFTSKDSENRTVPLTNDFHEFVKVFLRNRDPKEFCLKHGHHAGRGKYRYDFQRSVRSHFARCSVAPNTPAFGGGIPRSSLLRVSRAKPTSAPLQF
jgi:hypothetical protein